MSMAKKNKSSTMLSSNVQSIDLVMDCTTWRFWMMRQSIGHSTPAPRASAVKQWTIPTCSNNEEAGLEKSRLTPATKSYKNKST